MEFYMRGKQVTRWLHSLQSKEFLSIWLELTNPIQKNLILGGFYRQWSSESCKKEEAEEQGINIFIDQLEKATNEDKKSAYYGRCQSLLKHLERSSFST